MSYKIVFTPAADRDMRNLTREMVRRIDAAIGILRSNPRPPKAERLKGNLREYHRVRVGDFRIVYLIEDEILTVCVVRIQDRKDVYR